MSRSYGATLSTVQKLRTRIAAMPAGLPMPSIDDLARELTVSKNTIQRAYAVLGAEGYVEARPRKGVFVADRTTCGDLAIVARPENLSDDSVTPYYRIAVAMLVRRLQEQSPDSNVRVHTGRLANRETEFVATLDLLRPDVMPRLRGVVTFVPLFEMEQQLRDAGIAVVGLMRAGVQYRACFSDDFFARESIVHMARRGVRRIGVVGRVSATDRIAKLAASHGIEIQPQWCVSFNYANSEPTAYEGFSRIWRSGDRPEGLIVAEDVCARGVLRAATDLGVRFPEDMKLFTYAVRGIELPFPKPVSRVEYDPQRVVDSCVKTMQSLIAGDEPEAAVSWIDGELLEGETA